jgi:hypothetical protein
MTGAAPDRCREQVNSEQAELPVDERREVIAHEGQNRIRHGLQLPRYIVVVVDCR